MIEQSLAKLGGRPSAELPPGCPGTGIAACREPSSVSVAALALWWGLNLASSPVGATTGDVFEDFTTGQLACAGSAVARLVDVDRNGSFETQVVLFTLEGEAEIQTYPGFGHVYFFSFIDSHCGGTWPFRPKGRVLIRFVDATAPGWVENNSSTWTYKRIPAISVESSHDSCPGEGDAIPYLQVTGYRGIQQQDIVIGSQSGAARRFSDPIGIAELYATTDYCESQLDNLILYDSPQTFIDPPPAPEVAVLIDTSGSMSLGYDGTWNVPFSQQRITLARQAIEPFLVMLRDHYAGAASFGVSAFPDNLNQGYCTGYEARPMETVGAAAVNDTIVNTLPGLPVLGNTPLLGGLQAARATFTSAGNKAIVLLTDGYHNCPGPVSSTDPQVTSLVAGLNQDGIAVHAVGFGLPTDIDHALLEALSQQTSGQFYNVTGAGFDPIGFSPAVVLQETYKNIAVNTLGLESIVDPISTIASGAKRIHDVRLSPYETKVTFFVSWETPQSKRLDVSLTDSFGRALPLSGRGIQVTAGDTYRLITLDSSVLKGRVGATPWRLGVQASKLVSEKGETYQYSVVGESALRFRPLVFSPSSAPEVALTLMAQVTLNGKPVAGLDGLWVDVLAPAVVNGKPQKGRTAETLPLFDDGTHGDAKAGDGSYTLAYPGPKLPGTYSFDFKADGKLGQYVFERFVRVNKTLATPLKKTGMEAIRVLVEKSALTGK